MIRVLLADDHALVRSGFAMVLSVEDDIEVVAQAADGAAAVAAARDGAVDVALLDVQMPVMDGIEATRRIVGTGCAKVVIVTTFDREDYLFDALAAGASGFLLKNADPDDLVEAVRAVAGGHALLAPEATLRVIRALAADVSPAAPEPAPAPPDPARQRIVASLTEREHEVLRLVSEGLSNAEIAQRLFLGPATVKTHVSNILAKTGSRDRVQAVVFAHRAGLAG
ncbi:MULTISPECIES: response regulator transcription factor [unclassified Kocuria]|uniref:response regulator n=1 Tax=unclassified Kocuria TaxID=2649579 RepID=UPI00064A30E2|nr:MULTISPECIES: response regulator transcription factor [unclassified Kocuria]KLU08073.1 LuxR family transcriptional regulator [Kocuria sp. SM24M-10]OLT08705.1 DNA-binding response regulator [Kocuria sp. CNJ-770]